jgi:HK97 family phage portal protein
MSLIKLGLTQPTVTEQRSNPLESPSVPLSAGWGWGWLEGGRGSDAGELISDATAMQHSTVYSCVRILAESVSSLPLQLFTNTQNGKIQDVNSPLSYLLSVAPNEEMTSISWIETVMTHLSLTGNSYSEIQRSPDDGSPVALWPLNPRLTVPVRLPNGDLAYKTTDGEVAGKQRVIQSKDILHPLLNSWDGLVGMSPILQARQAVGLGIAAEKYGARLFANGAIPQLVMSNEAKFKPEDKHRMRADWEALQSAGNQHRIAILDQGTKLDKISMTAEESQFLGTRMYTRSDIAALFRVPSHYVGENQKLSNSNTEQMNSQFVTETLRPYLSKLEAEITRKLLRPSGKPNTLTVKFNDAERLRGDNASQTVAAATGRQWGWLSANDVRRSMGLNEGPPSLDEYITPINMENSIALLDSTATKPIQQPNEEGSTNE